MELERRFIERQDFSQARRGYDPVEVDRHLQTVAQAVEELKARADAQPQQATLAGTAASRVESIVAAAEASAREIEEKARADAQQVRDQAERDAAERITGAEEMVNNLTARAEELQREVADFVAQIGSLKGAVETIRTEFDAVAPVAPAAAAVPVDPADERAPAPALSSRRPSQPEMEAIPEPPAMPAAEPAEAPTAVQEPVPNGGGDAERASEGARLIALNMALSGAPREETARYLQENFDLADQDDLLDEVYARAGS